MDQEEGTENQKSSSNTTNQYNIRELHEFFIKYKLYSVGTAPSTIESYKINFRLLLQFKPDLTLYDLTEENMILFLEYLNTRERIIGKLKIVRPYKNSSIATVRGRLNTFFTWLIERKLLAKNPFEKMEYPEVSYTDKRAFNPKELEKICHAINTKIQWNSLLIKKRNIAIVMFLVYTGVRKEELIRLHLNDVNIESREIIIRSGSSKSKRGRIIPMHNELILYLQDYIFYRAQYTTPFYTTPFLWVSGTQNSNFSQHGLKHLMKLLSKATNINIHLHRFRHTFAVMYYTLTHDLIGLKTILGHRSLKQTLSYLRSIPDEHVVKQLQKMTLNEFI